MMEVLYLLRVRIPCLINTQPSLAWNGFGLLAVASDSMVVGLCYHDFDCAIHVF